MKRIMVGVVGAVLLLATMLPDTALAHSFVATTSLSIHKVPVGATHPGATVIVYGKLKSGRAFCRFDQVVKLKRLRPGPDPVLATTRTDREGEYIFVRKPKHTMTVYTKFSGDLETSYGHSHRCRPSRSDNLKLKVSG